MDNVTPEEHTRYYIQREVTPKMWLQAEAIENEIWKRKGESEAFFRAGMAGYRDKMKWAILVEQHFYDYIGLPWDPKKFSLGGDGGVDYTDQWGIKCDVKARDARQHSIAKMDLMIDWETYSTHGLRSDIYFMGIFDGIHTYLAGWINWLDVLQYGNVLNLRNAEGKYFRRIIINPRLIQAPWVLRERIWLANRVKANREWLREEDFKLVGSTASDLQRSVKPEPVKEYTIPEFND